MALNIAIIQSTVREGRLGPRVAAFFEKVVKARGHNAIMVDPQVHSFLLLYICAHRVKLLITA
jgi:hypothetical protein